MMSLLEVKNAKLIHASKCGKLEVCGLLLSQGADVNARDTVFKIIK